jgi:hypothetical protein
MKRRIKIMKRIFIHLIPLAMVLTAMVNPAAATIVTWDLSNITFAGGDNSHIALSGSFDYNTGTGAISGVPSITAHFYDLAFPPPFITVNEPATYAFNKSGVDVAGTNGTYLDLNMYLSSHYDFNTTQYVVWHAYIKFTDNLSTTIQDTVPLNLASEYSYFFIHDYTKTNYPYTLTDIARTASYEDGSIKRVPEPSTLLLLGLGLAGLWVWGRKKFNCI